MSKNYLLTVLLGLSCFAQVALGQAGYVSGEIITAKGDTIAVLIKDQNDKSSSSVCIVRKAAKSETTTYRPGELLGYLLDNGERYETRSVAAADGSSDSVRVFLKQLVTGELNLYYWRGRERADRYFIADPSGGLLELQGEQTRSINGRTYTVPGTYKNSLANLMAKCPPKPETLEELKLTASRMTIFVGDYNRCSSVGNLRYQYQPERARVFWVFRAGGGIADVDFIGSKIQGLSTTVEDFSARILPSVAVGRRMQIPDVSKRLYFQVELQVSVMQIRNQTRSTTNLISIRREMPIANTTNYLVQLPAFFSYEFLPGNFTPYAYVGGSATLNFLANLESDSDLDATALNRRILPQLLGGIGFKLRQGRREYGLDYRVQRLSLHQNASLSYTSSVFANVLTLSVALEQSRR